MTGFAPALTGFATIVLWGVVILAVILGARWLAEQRHRQDRETRRRPRRSRDRLPPNWHERD